MSIKSTVLFMFSSALVFSAFAAEPMSLSEKEILERERTNPQSRLHAEGIQGLHGDIAGIVGDYLNDKCPVMTPDHKLMSERLIYGENLDNPEDIVRVIQERRLHGLRLVSFTDRSGSKFIFSKPYLGAFKPTPPKYTETPRMQQQREHIEKTQGTTGRQFMRDLGLSKLKGVFTKNEASGGGYCVYKHFVPGRGGFDFALEYSPARPVTPSASMPAASAAAEPSAATGSGRALPETPSKPMAE